jgi:hypothetical protein
VSCRGALTPPLQLSGLVCSYAVSTSIVSPAFAVEKVEEEEEGDVFFAKNMEM